MLIIIIIQAHKLLLHMPDLEWDDDEVVQERRRDLAELDHLHRRRESQIHEEDVQHTATMQVRNLRTRESTTSVPYRHKTFGKATALFPSFWTSDGTAMQPITGACCSGTRTSHVLKQ